MNDQGFPSAASSAAAPAAPAARSFNRYLLLVDHDDSTRQATADTLSRLGYKVDAVEAGAIAWQFLQTIEYDLVVTTNHLPTTTGVEVLKMLYSAGRNQPAVVITDAGAAVEPMIYPWIEPPVVLSRPCTEMDLAGAVRRALRSSESTLGKILNKRLLNGGAPQRPAAAAISPAAPAQSAIVPLMAAVV